MISPFDPTRLVALPPLVYLIGGTLALGAAMWVFLRGLRAARTVHLARIGMLPSGFAFGALLWASALGGNTIVLRLGLGLASLTVGLAHAVAFSLAPLSVRRVGLRLPLVGLGLVAWTVTALIFVQPGPVLGWSAAVLDALCVASWGWAVWATRDRRSVPRGERTVESVRFTCPRCGTRVDWGRGVAPCTDCGLFVHLDWRPAEGSPEAARPAAGDVPRVEFRCPECGEPGEWPRGESACSSCGAVVGVVWNVHPSSR